MIDVEGLKQGGRVCAFIRHGEKDSEKFCLTEKGKRDISKFSQLLRLLQTPIKICSSPEDRCVETAVIINTIVNDAKSDIMISNVLGKPGIQVKNEAEYTKLTDVMRCRDIFKEWKMGMHYDVMNNPGFLKDRIMDFFIKTSLNHGITIYVSQSGTVACTGYSLGITDYQENDEDWVNYLDGYMLRL